MIKIEQKHWRAVSRRFWGTVFTLIIAVAVCVQLGRQAFPLLKDYKYEISGYFGKKLGMVLELDSIEADWSGLRPKLSLFNVLLKSREGETVFKIETATIELSILSSISNRRFTWRQLVFDGFETHFAQDELGQWSIPGMPEFTRDPNKPNRFSFDDPYDLFLLGRRINISDAKFQLDYFSGDNAALFIPDISIENDFDFHRIVASVDVGEGQETMSMVIEGDGDPRQENFIANGYFELNNFPTQNVFRALAIPEKHASASGHRTDLRLWFKSDAVKGVAFSGELAAMGEMVLAEGEYRAPEKIATEFEGVIDAEKGWDISLRNLTVDWEDKSAPEVALRLNGDLRGLRGVAVAEMDAQAWSELALYVGLNNEVAEKYLRGINPRGTLKNLHFQLSDKENGYFKLAASVVNGKSDAIMGAPALDNLNGYVETTLLSGRFDVAIDNGLIIDLPKVYKDPLSFERASGQLRWTIDPKNKHFYISSNAITLETDEEIGTGYLHLSLPFKKEYGEQTLTLSLAVEKTLATRHRVYIPKTIPKDLKSWLKKSVKGGVVKDARFVYHGSVEKNPTVSPSIQLRGKIEKGVLVYDQSWPRLNALSGKLLLDNNDLSIHVGKALSLGNALRNIDIKLTKDPVGKGPALAISGSMSGNVDTGMNFINNSPIKQAIGTTFDNWKMSGRVDGKASLIVPFDPKSAGHSQKVEINFTKAQAEISDIDLKLNAINGKLHYQTKKGVYANNLRANVWGERFKAKILSPWNSSGGQDTKISFSGKVDINDLYTWTSRPELKFAEGKSELSGELFIPGDGSARPLELSVASDLVGVGIQMPEPFTKDRDSKTVFSSRIRFYENTDEYTFALADQFRVALLVADEDPVSAIVEINEFKKREDTFVPIPQTGRFDISGYFDYFDLEQWLAAKDQYFLYEAESFGISTSSSAKNDDDIQASYSVFMNRFHLGSFEIEELSVRGKRESPFWLLEVKSELLAGRLSVPDDDSPIEVDLRYLRLEEDKPESIKDIAQSIGGVAKVAEDSEAEPRLVQKPNKVDITDLIEAEASALLQSANGVGSELKRKELPSVLADADLSSAVPVNFSTEEFSIGETDYGRWRFKLRPIEGGIVAHDIFAESKGMKIGELDAGAEFIWLKDGNRQSSQFSGVLTAGNLAEVFSAWDQETLMESESAKIEIDARWPGAPDQVTLEAVEGLIGLDIRRGSFTRGAGSDENGLLRLIALFNFDTIVRRLRLDFSDLTAQGYAFDSVKGNLDFKNGIIYLTEPLIVESSSSDTQLAGAVDLVEEKLDGEMVVTLPVASNIAVATAVVVGLPAALGVYVMSKLFKKQVDRASSLNISVTGDWEDPKVKIKKIFDINAAARRSEKLKTDSQNERQEEKRNTQNEKSIETSAIEKKSAVASSVETANHERSN